VYRNCPVTAAEATVTGQLRYTEGFYKASLADDFQKLNLQPMDLATIAQPMVYAKELSGTRQLKPDHDGFETPHLKIATKIIKEWATTDSGQSFKFEHILLEITNRSNKRIAYRVETQIDHPERCKSKGQIAHNAIALAPGESIRRTECLWRPSALLYVRSIEVMELNDLGYYYVSRLPPAQVLLDERTSAGHEVPKGKACTFVPWREIQSGAAAGNVTWPDIIDFYARHNCDEYSFWPGYTRWTAPGQLPSHAVAVAPAPAPPAPKPPG
jgi:hypothetical protein